MVWLKILYEPSSIFFCFSKSGLWGGAYPSCHLDRSAAGPTPCMALSMKNQLTSTIMNIFRVTGLQRWVETLINTSFSVFLSCHNFLCLMSVTQQKHAFAPWMFYLFCDYLLNADIYSKENRECAGLQRPVCCVCKESPAIYIFWASSYRRY